MHQSIIVGSVFQLLFFLNYTLQNCYNFGFLNQSVVLPKTISFVMLLSKVQNNTQ